MCVQCLSKVLALWNGFLFTNNFSSNSTMISMRLFKSKCPYCFPNIFILNPHPLLETPAQFFIMHMSVAGQHQGCQNRNNINKDPMVTQRQSTHFLQKGKAAISEIQHLHLQMQTADRGVSPLTAPAHSGRGAIASSRILLLGMIVSFLCGFYGFCSPNTQTTQETDLIFFF